MSEWISVNERLPEVGVAVWCYRPKARLTADPVMKVSHRVPYKNRSPQGVEHDFSCWCHVTHWMPLPSPPEQD